MKRFLIKNFYFVSWILFTTLSFHIPLQALNEIHAEPIKHYVIHQHELLDLSEKELKDCIRTIYHKFSEEEATEQLPDEFKSMCLQLDRNEPVRKIELIQALYFFITWLNEQLNPIQHNFEHDQFDNVKRGGGNKCCCTATKLLNQIIFMLAPIVRGIGSPGDTACDQTIFGILGDACVTLSGQSISQSLATIESELLTLSTLSTLSSLVTLTSLAQQLNDTVTTLEALTIELQSSLTVIESLSTEIQGTFTVLASIQNSVNGTFTALNACCNSTFSSIADLKNTVITDFNQTWTILNSLTNCCGGTFTALAAIQTSVNGTFTAIADVKSTLTTCCNNTLTTIQTDFNDTWTILGDVGVILGKGATISGTLLNIVQNIGSTTACCNGTFTALAAIQNSINGTFTAIADVKSTLTTCCNDTLTTIQTDFNDTWTILGDVGIILGRGATISGTLFNILQNTSSSTACCNGTFTALAAIQNSINGTFTAIADVKSTLTTCCNNTLTTIQTDFNDTWTILGDVGVILGQSATISGTLLNILQNTNTLTACCNNTFTAIQADFNQTWTILGDVGVILGKGATISGTLLNVLQNTNTLTTCCANTFTVLGDVGVILGKSATISGTLLNLIQDANGTFSVLGNPATILGPQATISGTLLSIYNIVNTCSAQYIHNSDVGTTGYTISKSGVYRLAENITFSPAAAATAITITTSNVLLDLQCFSISQGNAVQNVNGIKVSGSGTLFNVSVENGLVNNLSGTGIIALNLANFHLRDTTFQQLGLAGIDIEGTNNGVFVDHCDISLSCSAGNNIGAITPSLSCFVLSSVTNGIISNCSIYNSQIPQSGTSISDLIPFNMTSCNSVTVKNIVISGNLCTEVFDFSLTSCSEIILKDCSSQNESGQTGGDVNGFLLQSCSGISIFNGIVQGNRTAQAVAGFRLNATTGSLLHNCVAIDNDNSGGTKFRGIFFNGSTFNTARNCLISRNQSATAMAGIEMSSASNNLVSWCTVTFNSSTNDVSQGLVIDTSSDNNMIQDSDFSENTGDVDADSFGVNVVSGTNNLFTRVRAYNNGTTVANQLNGVPAGSIVNLTSTTMNDPAGPWGSASIVP